ncbi:WD40/YVTN/BNR-like repeat-containing protein [Mucilaginibacter sp. UYCu711]|uniref:WD40/YVTN/BNR-like repeat-containing protein n=1 Tax=Mucilaginibacter sp. UYCu711 TaxID=3156339 RepID=UPI003D1FBE97
MNKKSGLILLLFTLLSFTVIAQKAAQSLIANHVEVLQQDKPTSIRGLSVVNDNVAWISGSKGYIAVTTNRGKTWAWQQVKGFEKSDFRDIEAFSDKEAVIISSGTPALILNTTDGGINWKVNYRKDDSAYFLDAMDFDTSKHGLVMGDPINDKYLLLETKDGGNNWNAYNGPDAIKNQAAFAASGTCLVTKGIFAITTGGSAAEIITTNGTNWTHHSLPVVQGKSTQGAFSLAVSRNQLIVVGGDYQNDKRQDSTACYSSDKGLNWHLADSFPAGYQSCVEFIQQGTFLSTGTSGTNITINGGKDWVKIDDASYNVCRKAKHGTVVLLAGDRGRIGILKM